ncbi:PspC domain-containing protein [Allosphingosinicella sp.]|jgi:phage shock protein C|uniref:PspC domain-containing protein n=1 Tax=Allosphingosinicella sp. TaxID=2823234 RepID=UPI002F0AA3F4
MRQRKFQVDQTEGKLMGVCAGIGNHLGVDPTVVRIGFVVATILGGWPWTVIAYIVLGLVGAQRRNSRRSGSKPLRAVSSERGEVRPLDRRLAEIETYVAGSNGRLAREIDELR